VASDGRDRPAKERSADRSEAWRNRGLGEWKGAGSQGGTGLSREEAGDGKGGGTGRGADGDGCQGRDSPRPDQFPLQ
jgi:hypothetical protein